MRSFTQCIHSPIPLKALVFNDRQEREWELKIQLFWEIAENCIWDASARKQCSWTRTLPVECEWSERKKEIGTADFNEEIFRFLSLISNALEWDWNVQTDWAQKIWSVWCYHVAKYRHNNPANEFRQIVS